MNNSIISWILSSEERVFATDMPKKDLEVLRAMRNEPISFSLAYRSTLQKNENGRVPDMPISVRVSSDTLPVSVYKVCSVPFPACECEDADQGTLGACPDMLVPRKASPRLVRMEKEWVCPYLEEGERVLLNASCIMTQSVYVCVNEEGKALEAGKHTVEIEVISLWTGETLAKHRVSVDIIDATLPENDLIYTNWMHYDCLSESHGKELWSDGYFELLEKYVKNAAVNGMNTLLTPAFTPALDTPIGTERMNVQLVSVSKNGSEYSFDFSLLRRFVRMAKENGIKYFEHAHLFSQWGASRAINVYGKENGKTVRLFGWDTPASDGEYKSFLDRYLSAFIEFARSEGIEDRVFFHISDEPGEKDLESYANALESVKKHLDGRLLGDALSDYTFYSHGLVKLPIVDIACVGAFDGRCDEMMLYYTGGESMPGLTNRLLTSAPRKTRVLGLQLYRYNSRGFLHWAYNYTYGRLSQGLFDPAKDPCFYKNMPGVTYLVYPDTQFGCLPSLREKQMCAAINDYRALRLLESLVGRERTLGLCESFFGKKTDITTLPESAEEMIGFREYVNREIEKNINVKSI